MILVIVSCYHMFISTHLLKNYLPGVEPLEVDDGKEEVEEGGGDDEDRQVPAQPGEQVVGLVLLFIRSDVVAEGHVLLSHFVSWK